MQWPPEGPRRDIAKVVTLEKTEYTYEGRVVVKVLSLILLVSCESLLVAIVLRLGVLRHSRGTMIATTNGLREGGFVAVRDVTSLTY